MAHVSMCYQLCLCEEMAVQFLVAPHLQGAVGSDVCKVESGCLNIVLFFVGTFHNALKGEDHIAERDPSGADLPHVSTG